MTTIDSELGAIIEDVVVPEAESIDAKGVFPAAAVRALGEAGALGLTVPKEFGGAGEGLTEAATVVRRLAEACSSTAMVIMMHYSAVAAFVAGAKHEVLRDVVRGKHLSTLAFSEFGSRSHFWVPMGTAKSENDSIALNARKSWVTSAREAQSYVWSSRPVDATGAMTLWYVDASLAGLSIPSGFDGLGLRGNGSCPVTADGVIVSKGDMIGPDGAGLDLALQAVLPTFLVLNAAASVGLMNAVTNQTAVHLQKTRLAHLDQSLAQQPHQRTLLARMRIDADRSRALVDDTLAAIEVNDPRAQLRVLEVKAETGDSAAALTDLALEACGGAAFRRELGIERRFRDSRAARVMAPTSSALHDFIGRSLCGLPLMD